MKSKTIQRTIAQFNVLIDLGDEIAFLVYSFFISYKGLNNYDKIQFPSL